MRLELHIYITRKGMQSDVMRGVLASAWHVKERETADALQSASGYLRGVQVRSAVSARQGDTCERALRHFRAEAFPPVDTPDEGKNASSHSGSDPLAVSSRSREFSAPLDPACKRRSGFSGAEELVSAPWARRLLG